MSNKWDRKKQRGFLKGLLRIKSRCDFRQWKLQLGYIKFGKSATNE